MNLSGVEPLRLRRAGWDRLLHAKVSSCEVAVCIGGALLVGFIGVIAGGALLG